MLEADGTLLTWELRALPANWVQVLKVEITSKSEEVDALPLADHRLSYLDYEGAVSAGRGTVTRVDRGELKWLKRSSDRLEVELSGSLLLGNAVLSKSGDSWRLSFTPL